MSIALTHVEGQAIAVFGLARSGQATVRAALAGGAQSVFAWDDGDEPREGAKALGASVAEPATIDAVAPSRHLVALLHAAIVIIR